MNVGPTKDGMITTIYQQRLNTIGDWLRVNGEAIYGSKPWTTQNDTYISHVWYTSKNNNVYAISLFWPEHNELVLGSASSLVQTHVKVTLLGNDNHQLKVRWTLYNITIPINYDKTIKKTLVIKDNTRYVFFGFCYHYTFN